MRSPIPEPSGDAATSGTPAALEIPPHAARVFYRGTHSFGAMLRFTAKQFLTIPVCWVCAPLLLLCFLPYLALTVGLNYWLFNERGESTTALAPEGLWDVGKIWSYHIEWKRVLFVFDWGGDICIATFGGGSVLRREDFASREEAAEFAAIARELKKSRGQNWRPEWNGKVFGLKSQE